ncbi:neurexin-4-like isoform X2 [Anneissia japonica]|uniref:neurexin-4-like isoform X1 n=1 Tax=Anneissia japonica TaxID=1529436 RepID=UPI001425B024|nr:neurexin-4-like isoform X1 [Anneissia japonica]XP_033114752.1 neurexin-4-like isoform X2 [Anneissia japonica]
MKLSWIKLLHIFSVCLLVRKSEADRTCNAPLGMKSGLIYNSMVTASSSLSSLRGPEYGRLHWTDGEGGWTAATHDTNQYLTIDVGAVAKITKVASQGRHDSREWVTEYKLQYSNSSDDNTFQTYAQNGVQRKFIGNSDSDSVKSNDINPPIYARYIRFNPTIKKSYFSMRVELYGCLADSSVAMFEGSNYISYNVEKPRYHIVETEWNVTFRFRTTEANGVIMAGYGTQGDYLVFQLIQGQLMINVNLGSTDDVSGDSRFVIGGLLDDNQWHYVVYYRKRRAVRVSIDSIHMQGYTKGSFSRIDLDREVTFGGTPDFYRPGIYRNEEIPDQNFNGCLENMNFNGQFDVIGTVKKETNNPRLKVHGGQTFACTSEVVVPASFPTHESRLIIENTQGGGLSVSFRFRTYETNGVLLYNELFTGEPFQILIQGGSINILVGNELTGTTINSDGAAINDGLWHSVEVKIINDELQFIVDDFRSSTIVTATPMNMYYIGSDKEQTSLGFLGCMLDLMIGSVRVNFQALTPAENEGVEVNTCGLYDWCTPNPCEHDGTCQASWSGFSCLCPNGYGGSTCHRALSKRSCDAIQRTSGYSGNQLIDIDSSGPLEPFLVRCIFEDGVVLTELDHNSEGEIRVTGSNEPGSYKHDIDYDGVGMDQIRMLVSEAEHCEQYIKYRCKKSKLLNSPNGPQYGWWVSSTGEKMDYWGGAGPGTRKCACGIEGTCADSNKWCNCDIDDTIEREDSGILTQKPYLPVAQLRFGDFDPQTSTGYYTLDPLICRGEVQNPVTFRDQQAHLKFEIELTAEGGFDVYLEFKTTVYPAVLLNGIHETYIDYLQLELITNKKMVFSLDYGAGPESISIETDQELTDNMWHRVYIEMDPLEMYLEVDEANGVTRPLPYGDRNVLFDINRGTLFVGSTASQSNGYVGCMQSLRMNGKPKDMVAASRHAYYVVQGCTGHCDSRPCMNKGTCIERYSTFECNCEGSAFAGMICTQEVGVDLDEGSEVSYTIPSQDSLNSVNDVIVAGFSTVQNTEGRIVRIDSHAGNSFMEIKLNSEGAIQFSFAFGDDTGSLTEDVGSYADGNHHVVKVNRIGNAFSMMIDETSPTLENFDLSVSTFSSPSKITIGSPDGNNRFVGCISRVRFNKFYPLKMFDPVSQPPEIASRGLVVESNCGVEGATLPPTSKLPYPDFTYKMLSTVPPGQPSVAAVKTTGDKVSIAFVVLVLFVALGSMLFVIRRYMNRHGGEYHTNEDKGVAEAEDADAAVRASDPNHQGDRSREWFL